MDQSIVVALITVAGSIIAAALTFYMTKRHQFSMQWRNEKLNHYKILLSALSDSAIECVDQEKAGLDFSRALNTIGLVAPQNVIKALMAFHDEVKYTNQNRSPENHDRLLRALLIEIRKDIGLTKKDDPATFNFHLIGTAPKKEKS